jgi:hypothetical protein
LKKPHLFCYGYYEEAAEIIKGSCMKNIIATIVLSGTVLAIVAQSPLNTFLSASERTWKTNKAKIIRLWECRPSAPATYCSAQDKANSIRWLAAGTLSLITAALAGIGIGVGTGALSHEKEKAQQLSKAQFSPQERLLMVTLQLKGVKEEIAQLKEGLLNDTTRAELERLEKQKLELLRHKTAIELEVAARQ